MTYNDNYINWLFITCFSWTKIYFSFLFFTRCYLRNKYQVRRYFCHWDSLMGFLGKPCKYFYFPWLYFLILAWLRKYHRQEYFKRWLGVIFSLWVKYWLFIILFNYNNKSECLGWEITVCYVLKCRDIQILFSTGYLLVLSKGIPMVLVTPGVVNGNRSSKTLGW